MKKKETHIQQIKRLMKKRDSYPTNKETYEGESRIIQAERVEWKGGVNLTKKIDRNLFLSEKFESFKYSASLIAAKSPLWIIISFYHVLFSATPGNLGVPGKKKISFPELEIAYLGTLFWGGTCMPFVTKTTNSMRVAADSFQGRFS